MIPLKPTQLPVWATNDQIDSVSGANNVEQPPPELQTYGWPRGIFPPRNFFNWLGRQTYECLAYLFALQNQQTVVSKANSANSGQIVDPVNGGMALVTIIDSGAPANFYEGITWLPSSYAGGTSFTTVATSSTLTISSIAADGSISISGGTGPYIIYGQMKTP